MPPQALSNPPTKQKMAAFYTHVYCALNICSGADSFSKQLNYLKYEAINRGFSLSIINKAVNEKILQAFYYFHSRHYQK